MSIVKTQGPAYKSPAADMLIAPPDGSEAVTPLIDKTDMTPFGNRRATKQYEGSGTLPGSVFTLANSAIGSGVLAFPFALSKAGLVLGVVLTFIFALIMGMCLHFTVAATHKAQQRDARVRSFQDLAAAAGGPKAGVFIEVFLIIYLLGCCIGFLIVASDMIVPMLGSSGALGSNPRPVLIAVVGLCFCLPLSLLRRISALRFSSVFAVCAVTFLVIALIVEWKRSDGDATLFPGESHDVDSAVWDVNLLAALPLMAFAFQCHIQAPLIFTELKSDVRTVAKMDRVCAGAYAICCALYVPAGIFGYLTFGRNVLADILLYKDGANGPVGYPETNKVVDVARVCLACTAVCGFPLNHFPARTALWGIYQRQMGVLEAKMPKRWLLAEGCVWCVICVGVACGVKDLGTVFGLIGSICGALVIFLFPALFWWKYGPDDLLWGKLPAAFTFAVGALVFIMGTLTTLNVV
eukprot:g60.t1